MKEKLDTKVGENGVTLSGCQKIRLSIARNLYKGGQIYFLDDPLSALDLKVGTYIMEKTILQQLKSKTRVIVTHAIQYIKYADRVFIMEDGRITKQGTYEEVQDTPLFVELQKTFKSNQNNLENQNEPKNEEIKFNKEDSVHDELRMLKDESGYINLENQQIEKLFFAEDREMGKVSFKLILQVLKHLGGTWIFFSNFI